MTNENHDYCARIAQELENYAAGRCWMVGGDTAVSDTEPDGATRQLYIDDYFDNEVLDIEYTVSGNLDYLSAKWYVGIGGTAAAVDAAAEEAYNMARGC